MYYKAEYDNYYKSLSSGTDSIKSAVVGLNDSITEVSNQFNSVSLLLGEMRGEFAIEISSSIDGLLTEMKGLKNIIDDELAYAIAHMCSLGTSLGEFKPKDKDLDKADMDYKNTKRLYYSQDKVADGTITQGTYDAWIQNLANLSKTIESLSKRCLELKDICDADIGEINEFNNEVMNLRLKLAAVAASTGNVKIEDIDKMSINEKKAYLDKLVKDITAKYNQYKKLYEYYSKDFIRENCTDLQLWDFSDIYSELLSGVPGFPSIRDAFESGNPITRGNAIISMIEMLNDPSLGVNGKTILEIITAYSKGASWKDSGMNELYLRTESDAKKTAFQWNDDLETLFWNRASNVVPELRGELLDNFLEVAKVLDKSKDGFSENYKKAVNSAMVIKGVKGLKECLVFDYTYKDAKLDNYPVDEDLMFKNGFYVNDYTTEESKMISYLLNQGDYDAAEAYVEMRQDSINRRNGMLAADEYYRSIHDGNNAGVDAVVDHFRVGAKGFGDGVYSFTDGLIDLIAPDSVMSEHDYETIYFLQSLKNSGDSYDNSLLTDYRICNKVGTYTIPTVVNAVTGGQGGTLLFIASDLGNGMEEQMVQTRQAANSYDSLVLEGATRSEAFISAAAPYMISDLPNDVASSVIGLFKNVNPVLGATLDVVFDEIWKNNVV